MTIAAPASIEECPGKGNEESSKAAWIFYLVSVVYSDRSVGFRQQEINFVRRYCNSSKLVHMRPANPVSLHLLV